MYDRLGRDLPEPPEIPEECQYVSDAFWDLNNLRSNNGFGLNPVTWMDLEAWQRGTGNVLSNDETKTIMWLFRIYDQLAADYIPMGGKES